MNAAPSSTGANRQTELVKLVRSLNSPLQH